MKFCRQCGCQLNDEDKFCCKCGKACDPIPSSPDGYSSVVGQQIPQQNPAFNYPNIPQPGPNEAMLVVVCNSINPKGNVLIKNGTGRDVIVKNGESSAMKVAVGNMTIRYVVDRGPGLTLVAARKTSYTKGLIFHPGETIMMQVRIGREINQAAFQSSLGGIIL